MLHEYGLIVAAFIGLAGRFWADDREAQTSRRSSRRSGESNERGAGARDAPRPRGRLRQGVGSDSDDSGIIESKEEKEEERGFPLCPYSFSHAAAALDMYCPHPTLITCIHKRTRTHGQVSAARKNPCAASSSRRDGAKQTSIQKFNHAAQLPRGVGWARSKCTYAEEQALPPQYGRFRNGQEDAYL